MDKLRPPLYQEILKEILERYAEASRMAKFWQHDADDEGNNNSESWHLYDEMLGSSETLAALYAVISGNNPHLQALDKLIESESIETIEKRMNEETLREI